MIKVRYDMREEVVDKKKDKRRESFYFYQTNTNHKNKSNN